MSNSLRYSPARATDTPSDEGSMTDQGPNLGARSFRPVLLAGLVVIAIGIGVGAGSLLARAVGSSRPTASIVIALPSAPSVPGLQATAEPSPTPSPEPTPALVPAPLTGLPILEAAALQHPIAVMIDDQRNARPQSGFNAAAQVWQAPAEGGIPRYLMIYQDRLPPEIGPIRSARQYFIEWAAEWKALFVHIGGSGQAMATLAARGQGQLVYNADGFRFDGTDMWRIKERAAPHNVYSDADHLRAMAAKVGATDVPLTPVWSFGDPVAAEARPTGTSIAIHYPYETITYRYDPVGDRYRRFIDLSDVQQIDAADGQPVAPANVVILRMQFSPLNDGHPEKKRLEAQDVGSGAAIISSGGRIILGTWRKAAEGAPTLLFGPKGTPVTLTAGQTFVQVIALSYSYEAIEGTVPGNDRRQF